MNFKIEITQTPAGIDFNIIGNPTVEKVTQALKLCEMRILNAVKQNCNGRKDYENITISQLNKEKP